MYSVRQSLIKLEVVEQNVTQLMNSALPFQYGSSMEYLLHDAASQQLNHQLLA